MSWSFRVEPCPTKEFPGALAEAVERQNKVIDGWAWSQDAEKLATREQIAAAYPAAMALWASGTVGSTTGDGWVQANLAGHANPGHTSFGEVTRGHETVSVTVSAAPPPPEPSSGTPVSKEAIGLALGQPPAEHVMVLAVPQRQPIGV